MKDIYQTYVLFTLGIFIVWRFLHSREHFQDYDYKSPSYFQVDARLTPSRFLVTADPPKKVK